jgi:hypothetical protein
MIFLLSSLKQLYSVLVDDKTTIEKYHKSCIRVENYNLISLTVYLSKNPIANNILGLILILT